MQNPAIYADYFDRYTSLVREETVTAAFHQQEKSLSAFMSAISEEKSTYAYAEEKWTLKEMMQHLVDCERIFAYRALAIARKDPANLPGFEENDYAKNSSANSRSWESLKAEMTVVRLSTKALFESFKPDMLNRPGTFNNNTGTAVKLGLIIVGHTYHHISIAKERYNVTM